ncbi:MAG: hypothetical protein K2X76_08945, partial [Sphingomonas sp.]|nr:hypothetical protein [Sphingomonas sp.]
MRGTEAFKGDNHSRRHVLAAGRAILAALLLATPGLAQQAQAPAPYTRAIAAGYKAAFLCSGVFIAGRAPAQIEALELTGIYP